MMELKWLNLSRNIMASVNKYFYSVGSEEEDADDTDPEGPKENWSDDLNTRLDLHNSVDAVVEANNSATGEAGISGCKRKRNDNETRARTSVTAHSGTSSEVQVENQDVEDDGIERSQLVKKCYGKDKQVCLLKDDEEEYMDIESEENESVGSEEEDADETDPIVQLEVYFAILSCMNEIGVPSFQYGPNITLGNTMLAMGIYTAKWNFLITFPDMLYKGLWSKGFIVTLYVFQFNIISSSKSF